MKKLPTTRMVYKYPTTQIINLQPITQTKNAETMSQIKNSESITQIKNIETTNKIVNMEILTQIKNQDSTSLNINRENIITELPERLIETSTRIKKYITNKDIENMIKNLLYYEIKDNETNYYNTIMEIIESNFTDENYDRTNLENGVDESLYLKNFSKNAKVTFTTTENLKSIINYIDMTSIVIKKFV